MTNLTFSSAHDKCIDETIEIMWLSYDVIRLLFLTLKHQYVNFKSQRKKEQVGKKCRDIFFSSIKKGKRY